MLSKSMAKHDYCLEQMDTGQYSNMSVPVEQRRPAPVAICDMPRPSTATS